MLNNNPTTLPSWKNLSVLAENQDVAKIRLNDLFLSDETRFEKFSLKQGGILLDYSKQFITDDVFDGLMALANAQRICEKRDALFAGDKVNKSENRAALHSALRDKDTDTLIHDDMNIMDDIHGVWARLKKLSDDITQGKLKGASGKNITDIIILGTGGSIISANFMCDVLSYSHAPVLTPHFISNIDKQALNQVLEKLHPEKTLVIMVSKSFRTKETLLNARAIQDWCAAGHTDKPNINIMDYFYAISANQNDVMDFGVLAENFLPVWEWVNGRFSLWSAVGIPIVLSYGFKVFEELLSGAHAMDIHFKDAPLPKNMPVILAMVGIWNINFKGMTTHALIPYKNALSKFIPYIQQLEMESNGKNIDLNGDIISEYHTAPVIFGDIGTDAQHSFFQMLHQGTQKVPCDFIGVGDAPSTHYNLLMNNMLAQAQALMQGAPQNPPTATHFEGNKPSNCLILDDLSPYHLGQLIALYEHKCAVQGMVWNINSFDQFGVELGKKLTQKIESGDFSNVDGSTLKLISYLHSHAK